MPLFFFGDHDQCPCLDHCDALQFIVETGSGGNEQRFERMSIPLPFPEDVLEEIRMFDGNNKCCDCPSLDTDWASVSHGTLICLDCAGRHRGLGVHVSFVRSITMDTWSTQQVRQCQVVEYAGRGPTDFIFTLFRSK